LNWRDMLAEALGLDPQTVSDDELKAALKAALGTTKAPDPEALNAAIGTAVAAAVKPLSTQVEALSASEVAFKLELEKRDKQSLLDQAGREGKVVALNADAVGKLTVDDLKAHVAALPVTVPLSARTPSVIHEPATKPGPSDSQREIALNCGLDPEQVWPKESK